VSSMDCNIKMHSTGQFVTETVPGRGNELVSSLVADIKEIGNGQLLVGIKLFSFTTTITLSLVVHCTQ